MTTDRKLLAVGSWLATIAALWAWGGVIASTATGAPDFRLASTAGLLTTIASLAAHCSKITRKLEQADTALRHAHRAPEPTALVKEQHRP